MKKSIVDFEMSGKVMTYTLECGHKAKFPIEQALSVRILAIDCKECKPMPRIKFYWNGIRVNGGKLQRCYFSYRNWVPSIDPETVGISAKDYDGFSAEIHDLFKVENATDSQSDYFDKDRIKVTPTHPFYTQVKAAFDAMEAHHEKRFSR